MLPASVLGDEGTRLFQSHARRANCMSEILHSLESNGDSVYLAGRGGELNLRALEIDFRADPRWRPFVAAHPNGTAYHHPLWLEALEKEYGQRIVTLACESGDGQLRALLPLIYTKGLPFRIGGQSAARRLSSLPRTPIGGPLSIDRLASAVVLRAAIKLVRQDPGTRLQLKTHEVGLDELADSLACTFWRHTYVLDLPNRPEDLRFGNPRNRNRIRWAVNKAAKHGVRVRPAETADDLKAWYEIYLDTMRRNVVPPRPYRFFEALWGPMRSGGLMQLLLAEQVWEKGKRLLAGSIFLMFGRTVCYAFNGAQPEDFSLRPNDAIQWHAIHDACKAGFRLFDFGEVPEGNTHLAEFKSKWGAEPKQLLRYHHPPLKMSDGEESEGYSQRLTRVVWQRLPLKATAWMGDWLYRFL
jgi:hypothetical protein